MYHGLYLLIIRCFFLLHRLGLGEDIGVSNERFASMYYVRIISPIIAFAFDFFDTNQKNNKQELNLAIKLFCYNVLNRCRTYRLQGSGSKLIEGSTVVGTYSN